MAAKKPAVAKEAKKPEGPILIGRLNNRQEQLLAKAMSEVQQAANILEQTKNRVAELVNMGMPSGANTFNIDNGCYYYDPEKGPLAKPPEESLDSREVEP
jgi:hypothetical protein